MFAELLRLRRQAPAARPPKGYYDVRVNVATGQLVLVDHNGTETAIGSVTSVAGRTGAVTLASADITDATDDGNANKGKVLKTSASGGVKVATLHSVGLITAQGGVSASYLAGAVLFSSSDPHVVGQWWDNAGTLTRSAG